MPLQSFLYGFLVATLCAALSMGFLVCSFVQKSRKALLMAGIYLSYLASELLRNLSLLLGDHPAVIAAVTLDTCVYSALYYFIVLDQSAQEIRPFETVALIALSSATIYLSLNPNFAHYVDSLPLITFVWGIWKLWPVRTINKRSKGIFRLLVTIVIAQSFTSILSVISPSANEFLFGPFTEFALPSRMGELIFWAVNLSSILDLKNDLTALSAAPNPALQTREPKHNVIENLASAHSLTKRETEILTLIAQGLSSKEIAERLGISGGTVNVHTHNMYRKMGISNRRQVFLLALAGEKNT